MLQRSVKLDFQQNEFVQSGVLVDTQKYYFGQMKVKEIDEQIREGDEAYLSFRLQLSNQKTIAKVTVNFVQPSLLMDVLRIMSACGGLLCVLGIAGNGFVRYFTYASRIIKMANGLFSIKVRKGGKGTPVYKLAKKFKVDAETDN